MKSCVALSMLAECEVKDALCNARDARAALRPVV